eukprot:scaffold115605_cov75-Phaeocystis_antarctica.AAC.1
MCTLGAISGAAVASRPAWCTRRLGCRARTPAVTPPHPPPRSLRAAAAPQQAANAAGQRG